MAEVMGWPLDIECENMHDLYIFFVLCIFVFWCCCMHQMCPRESNDPYIPDHSRGVIRGLLCT